MLFTPLPTPLYLHVIFSSISSPPCRTITRNAFVRTNPPPICPSSPNEFVKHSTFSHSLLCPSLLFHPLPFPLFSSLINLIFLFYYFQEKSPSLSQWQWVQNLYQVKKVGSLFMIGTPLFSPSISLLCSSSSYPLLPLFLTLFFPSLHLPPPLSSLLLFLTLF